jgi:hypothetical protein
VQYYTRGHVVFVLALVLTGPFGEVACAIAA